MHAFIAGYKELIDEGYEIPEAVEELMVRDKRSKEQLAIATAIMQEQAEQLRASLEHVRVFTEDTDQHLEHQSAGARTFLVYM